MEMEKLSNFYWSVNVRENNVQHIFHCIFNKYYVYMLMLYNSGCKRQTCCVGEENNEVCHVCIQSVLTHTGENHLPKRTCLLRPQLRRFLCVVGSVSCSLMYGEGLCGKWVVEQNHTHHRWEIKKRKRKRWHATHPLMGTTVIPFALPSTRPHLFKVLTLPRSAKIGTTWLLGDV